MVSEEGLGKEVVMRDSGGMVFDGGTMVGYVHPEAIVIVKRVDGSYREWIASHTEIAVQGEAAPRSPEEK